VRVLVIEDDERLADVLARGLADAGHEPAVRANGTDGLAAALSDEYDALVLDWMLPGLDGPAVCRALRAAGRQTPVLMLTARQSVPYRINGLDAGADDYLTKPFSFDELLARLRVFARRTGHDEQLVVGDLVIDRDRRVVQRAGTAIELTAREFDLLAALARDPGVVLSRDMLLEDVWGTDFPGETRTVDVHVSEVRRKLGDDGPPIETIRGVGYRLVPPVREPVPSPLDGSAEPA